MQIKYIVGRHILKNGMYHYVNRQVIPNYGEHIELTPRKQTKVEIKHIQALDQIYYKAKCTFFVLCLTILKECEELQYIYDHMQLRTGVNMST